MAQEKTPEDLQQEIEHLKHQLHLAQSNDVQIQTPDTLSTPSKPSIAILPHPASNHWRSRIFREVGLIPIFLLPPNNPFPPPPRRLRPPPRLLRLLQRPRVVPRTHKNTTNTQRLDHRLNRFLLQIPRVVTVVPCRHDTPVPSQSAQIPIFARKPRQRLRCRNAMHSRKTGECSTGPCPAGRVGAGI